MQIEKEQIRVRGRNEPASVELRFTRHGPVIYQDEARNVAVALKWAGSEPGGAAYLASLSVARAKNRQEFVAALARWKIPCLNFVYADVEGNIGWVAAAATPYRAAGDGLLPVPGWTDKYAWRGYLPVEELPQAFNPPGQWLATANHNILPPGYEKTVAFEWSAPYRYERIRERLTQGGSQTREQASAGQEKFTLADFQDIQHENTSLPARQLAAVLKQVQLPAELAPYAQLLIEWDGVLSVDAQAGPLYAVWMQELQKAFYAGRIELDPRLERGDLRSTPVMLRQLADPEAFWFGKDATSGRDRLVRETLAKAVARTRQLLKDDARKWRWGDLHTATFRHPLADWGPEYAAAFNAGPVPRPGDVNTPNNTRHDDSFQQVHGATYRQVIDLVDWDAALATSAPGQSGQPGSPHYSDLLPLWAAGKYFPLAYSRTKVQSVAKNRLALRP
jgi:penicillin amidase